MSDNLKRTLWSIGTTVAGYYIMTAMPGVGGIIIASGVMMASSYVGNELMPIQQEVAEGVLINKHGNDVSIPVIYGSRRIGGTRVALAVTGDESEHLRVVLAHCEGEVSGIEKYKHDDRLELNDPDYGDEDWWEEFSGEEVMNVPNAGGQPSYTWQPYDTCISADLVATYPHAGADNQIADSGLVSNFDGWTDSHKLSGIAYSYLYYEYDADTWVRGVPTCTALVNGRLIYDARTEVTAHSSNPALVLRDYLTNERYGRGIDEALIDDDSFNDCADYCETELEQIDGLGETYTAKLYNCNAVVNTGAPFMDNVTQLLTSCRGMLVFTAGKYKLKMDRPADVTFAFNEDNIAGKWEVHLGDIKERCNRVKARFVNPVTWMTDFMIADSETLRDLDDGRLLEREIDLSCCIDPQEAYRHAVIELNASRQQLRASFTAVSEGLECEVGDVVSVTHSTTGWDVKEFRVTGITILSDSEVSVQVQEYDVTTYEYGVIQTVDYSINTNLPDPLHVEPPGAPSVIETLYTVGTHTSVKAKATVSWGASADANVADYEISYKKSNWPDYLIVGTTTDTTIDAMDIIAGGYTFRVRAINRLGVRSAWAANTVTMYGLTGAPDDVDEFTLANLGEFALLSWQPMTGNDNLDVLHGGHFEVRFSGKASPVWNNSFLVDESIAGGQTSTVVPLRSGTYFIKAVDSSGNSSVNAMSASTDGAELVDYTLTGAVIEDPAFSGTKTNMTENSGTLYVDAAAKQGEYEFNTGMDAGSVKAQRLQPEAVFEIVNRSNQIDNRTESIDDWDDFDGDDSNARGNLYFKFRSTNDDPSGSPTWSDWQRVFTGVVECRGLEFMLVANVDSADYNIEITQLRAYAHELS